MTLQVRTDGMALQWGGATLFRRVGTLVARRCGQGRLAGARSRIRIKIVGLFAAR